ncbi:molybdenum ABC transporter ATP-binding protein [Phaeobacter sp.]|uniref:molybdenum ABC transporter ATP-binding protein n=1 Tax=Phaeobacter sp. TaxID=1902409 RepID=UPI0025FCC261|nr:molybdenum ABC transporter ATP-binding protein [Phaeobacter sp.]
MIDLTLAHQLQGFALDIEINAPPGVTVLFGRSGAGKTSVISAVAGLLTPRYGRIKVAGQTLLDTDAGVNLPSHQRRIGYIFQDNRLFPHLTVEQNLTYGQRFTPKSRKPADFDDVVDLLGLAALLKRSPHQLSGGEKQRVAIGRAILSAPDLVLADEPLAALDDAHKAEILPYFEQLRDILSVPMLYVTHSVAEVARMATTVAVIDQGRCLRCGPTADILTDPAALPTGVRAAGAVLYAKVQAHHQDGLTELDAGGIALFLPGHEQAIGKRIRVRIAAHDVILSRERPDGLSALNIFPGTITQIRRGDGPGAMVTLQTKAGTLLARVTRRSADAMNLQVGGNCHAIVKTVSVAREDVGGASASPPDPVTSCKL